ncbi:DsbC/DsbD-like thiol-disulfide interchange protein [Cereibacter ovatus]|uniref:DsbC/DsbD-like thiol-disulfide interchange protein n=1 Tax=Cereibacter ovatus TaxID=439529 RepID=A0A285CVE5_9RHOB|nr:protein-disulfide reductase DsbD domain-containing protein [Cereibacter ovatus]SNX71018.1 DsbC/DsbD-like thiol-disulfide interchange protein [Cereibacter ovatus]
MPIRLALAVCLCLAGSPVVATTQDDILRAEILPGWRDARGTHMAGLRLRLASGWKTYWRSPGDAGIPPEFDWSGSDNVASVRLHWPAPHVFTLNGMQTIGYRGDLVLPFEVEARDPSRPIRLRAAVELGVCRDICVPAALDLAADLPAGGVPDGAIKAALKARPATGPEAGLGRIACRVEPIPDGLRLTAEMDLPASGTQEVVVMEPGQPSVWVSEPVTSRAGGRLTATSEMVGPTGTPFALDRSAMTLTVLGDRGAVEIRGCPAP